jgi:hypothetical protein
VQGSADVPGIGIVEYARYAVPADGFTTDGCSKLSTHGTLYVGGGSAEFDGKPANTCGTGPSGVHPDAHYLYTISHGAGALAGATGSGDIVADHGVDVWKGTLVAPQLVGVTVPLASPAAEATTAPPTDPATSATGSSTAGSTPAGSATTPAAAGSPANSPANSPSAAPATAPVAATSSSSTTPVLIGIVAAVLVGVGIVLAGRRKRRMTINATDRS